MACPIIADTEDAPGYEGDLPICWISSCRQPTIDSPPPWVLKSAMQKNVIVKSKIFPHQNIQKHTWTSAYGKTPKQMWANEQTAQITDMERPNLKNLIMWNLNNISQNQWLQFWRSFMIKRISAGPGKILEEISTIGILSYNWMKQHKPWFVAECSKFVEQMKQAKLHYLHHPDTISAKNLNNTRR